MTMSGSRTWIVMSGMRAERRLLDHLMCLNGVLSSTSETGMRWLLETAHNNKKTTFNSDGTDTLTNRRPILVLRVW